MACRLHSHQVHQVTSASGPLSTLACPLLAGARLPRQLQGVLQGSLSRQADLEGRECLLQHARHAEGGRDEAGSW
jgi:hypothetical protein